MVKPGTFNHRVTLKRPDTTKDTMGQPVATSTVIGYAFASIAPVSGNAYMRQSGEVANVTHRATMRARNDITLRARDVMVFGSRNFEVRAVLDELESGRVWTVLCFEQLQTVT